MGIRCIADDVDDDFDERGVDDDVGVEIKGIDQGLARGAWMAVKDGGRTVGSTFMGKTKAFFCVKNDSRKSDIHIVVYDKEGFDVGARNGRELFSAVLRRGSRGKFRLFHCDVACLEGGVTTMTP